MCENIIVAFGGVSNENEISIITGTMTANVLKSGGYNVYPLYISQSGEFFCDERLCDINLFKDEKYLSCRKADFCFKGLYLFSKKGKIKGRIEADCIVNCCHGGWGEGGGLSGIAEAYSLPIVGTGIFSSSAFMDKYFTKLVLKALGVKRLPYTYLKRGDEEGIKEAIERAKFPVIVKPASLGSSIGVEKAENEEELKTALYSAFIYDDGAIIEKYLANRREINCAAYFADGEITVSECEEALGFGDVFSFEQKYEGGAKSKLPADLPQSLSNYIRAATKSVYQKLNMRGIARFDYILSGGEAYLSEINTVPGSLSYYLFCKDFPSFFKILSELIAQAKSDFKNSRKKLLKTGILQNMPSNSCKSRKNKL